MLQQFRPPDEVAVYYAAAKTLALVSFIYYSVSATTAHRFSVYHVAGDRAGLTAFIARSIRWTFWPSVAATVLLLAIGRPLLRLFGAQFADGYHLMFIRAAGILARAAIGPIERLSQHAGPAVHVRDGLWDRVRDQLRDRPGTVQGSLGAAGAATATTTALVIESIMLFIVTRNQLGFHAFVWGHVKR